MSFARTARICKPGDGEHDIPGNFTPVPPGLRGKASAATAPSTPYPRSPPRPPFVAGAAGPACGGGVAGRRPGARGMAAQPDHTAPGAVRPRPPRRGHRLRHRRLGGQHPQQHHPARWFPRSAGDPSAPRKEMTHAWFESVAEAQRRAKKRLPKCVYNALIAGSEKGIILADNQAAFDELGFAPKPPGCPANVTSPPPPGPDRVHASDHLPHPPPPASRPSAPEGDGGGGTRRRVPVHAMGLSSLPANRSRMSWPPTRRRSSRSTGATPATRSSNASTGHTAGVVGVILTLDWSFFPQPGL